MKQLLNFSVFIIIIVAAVWLSWDYIVMYIPIIKDWFVNLFNNFKGLILSAFPALLVFFIFMNIINDN